MTRPENPTSVALDSGVVIGGITGNPSHSGGVPKLVQILDRILEAARGGRIDLFASTMLLVEARGQGHMPPFDPDLEAMILDRITQPHWIYVELDRSSAIHARQLAITHSMGNADAIHLAAAIEAGAEVFMTTDPGFPLDQEIEGTWVCKPYAPDGPDIFLDED